MKKTTVLLLETIEDVLSEANVEVGDVTVYFQATGELAEQLRGIRDCSFDSVLKDTFKNELIYKLDAKVKEERIRDLQEQTTMFENRIRVMEQEKTEEVNRVKKYVAEDMKKIGFIKLINLFFDTTDPKMINKIQAIKFARSISNQGLKEAKDMVDNVCFLRKSDSGQSVHED